MKLVVVSDLHLDAVTAGVSRFEEISRALDYSVAIAANQEADAYMFLGDMCDPDTGSSVFRCVEKVLDVATKLRREGITSYWLTGNHDVIEDGSGDSTLAPLRALWRARPLPDEKNRGQVYYVDRPGYYPLRDRMGVRRAWMVALPYTAASHTYDPAKAFSERPQEDAAVLPLVVAGHLNVPGVVPGSETHEMPRGRDVWFPYDHICNAVGNHPVLMLNGHYHAAAKHYPRGEGLPPVYIPGTLARLSFVEGRNTPAAMVVEVPQ